MTRDTLKDLCLISLMVGVFTCILFSWTIWTAVHPDNPHQAWALDLLDSAPYLMGITAILTVSQVAFWAGLVLLIWKDRDHREWEDSHRPLAERREPRLGREG